MNARASSPAARITTGVLSLGLLFPLASFPTVKNHVVAFARTVKPAPRVVHLAQGGEIEDLTTTAATVADVLREKGILPTADDAVSPGLDTPVWEGLTIEFRAAVPVTLVTAGASLSFRTSAQTVVAFLAQHEIELGPQDRVTPALDQPLLPDSTVRISHVTDWTERIRRRIAPTVEHRLDPNLAPEKSKVISAGRPAVRETLVRYRRIDDNPKLERTVLSSRKVVASRPKIIASGIVAYERYSHLAQRAERGTVRLANAALRMLASAYTAHCAGCSGVTASGSRAGHGIVAVDPGTIPLGTRLYIPGYGHAIAGDTGGAIRGRRIDLGFESGADAIRFGMREIVVYVLK